jgi:hypothetical protein
MSMDSLYERVTEAILRAERLEAEGPPFEANQAYLNVSFLEEEIAEALPPSDPEGGIARRGAVRAALTAGLPIRAKELADRYVAEAGVPPALAAELNEMARAAEASLDLPALRSVCVVPGARYKFHGEAA